MKLDPILLEIKEDLGGGERMIEMLEQIDKSVTDLKVSQQESAKASKKAVDEYADAVIDSVEAIGKKKKATDDLGKVEDKLKGKLRQSAKEFEIFGISVGDAQEQLKSKSKSLGVVVRSLKTTSGALKVFKLALASTGIGLIVVALGSLVAFLTKTQRGLDLVNQVLAVTGSIIDNVIERAARLVDAFGFLINGDLSAAADTAKGAFSGLGDEILRDAEAALKLERASQKLRDSQRDLKVEFAEQRAEIEKLRNVGEDITKTETERAAALQKAISIENELEKKRLVNARENLRIIQEKNSLGESLAEDLDAEAEARIAIAEIEADAAGKLREDTNKLNALQKEAADRRRAELEAERQAAEKLAAEYKKLTQNITDQLEALQQGEMSAEERLFRQKELAIQELNELEKLTISKAEMIGKSENEIQELRNDFAEARLLTERKYANEIRTVEIEGQKEVQEKLLKEREAFLAKQEKLLQDNLNSVKVAEQIAINEVSILKKGTDEILTLEQEKQKKILEIKIDSAEKQLALLVAQGKGESDAAKLLRSEINVLRSQLADIGSENTLFTKIREKLKDLFNVDDEQLNFAIDQFARLGAAIADNFTSGIETAIKEQEKLIEQIDKQVDKAEDALDRELELKKAGFANNFAEEKANLEALQAEREKAAKEAEALKLKQAKRQIAIDTAQQISSQVLAATELFKAHTGVPFVGVALAVGFLGTMLATINKLKAAKASVKLFTGGRVPLGGKDDRYGEGHRIEGTNIQVGAGEWVMNREVSDEHNDFLNDLNAGRYAGVDLSRLPVMDIKEPYSYPFTNAIPKLISNFVQTEEKVKKEQEEKLKAENEGYKREMQAMRVEMKNMRLELKNRPHFVLDKNDKVVQLKGQGYDLEKRVLA